MTLKLCQLVEYFLWKNHAENVHQKLVPDPFLILVKNQNSNCMQESLLNIRYFDRGLSKIRKKVNSVSSSEPHQSKEKVIKNKRGFIQPSLMMQY